MNSNQPVVIITGAGRGIGRELAAHFARAKWRVAATDLREEAAQTVATTLTEEGGTVLGLHLDVRDEDSVHDGIEGIRRLYGRVDVLINNAGIGLPKPLDQVTAPEWDDVLNTNLRGAFLCSREAAQVLGENGGGAIINIASTRALMSEPNSEAYAASKGGLLALTHALAISLAPKRIRVNAISPGWIHTGEAGELTPLDHAQHPAGRVGTPGDIASACFFLADPRNDFITGQNLVVDGGMTCKMIYT